MTHDYDHNQHTDRSHSDLVHVVSSGSFGEESTATLEDAKRATIGLLRALRTPVSGTAVAQRLGVERTLGWRLAKIASTASPAEIVERAPSRQTVRRICEVARAAGATGQAVDSFNVAWEGFERWRERHGPDRTSLAAMVAQVIGEPQDTSSSPSERRVAARALASIFGIWADVRLKLDVIVPSAAEGRVDILSINGYLGMQALRPDIRWPLGRLRLSSGEGDPRPGELVPLDPGGVERFGAPVVEAFCEGPIPAIAETVHPDGSLQHDLTAWPMGANSPISVLLGVMLTGVGQRRASGPTDVAEMHVSQHTPCGVSVHDMVVHRDLWPEPAKGEHITYSDLGPLPNFPAGRESRLVLDLGERVEPLGPAPEALFSPDSPRHEEMFRWMCAFRGLEPRDFDVYRTRIPHPPIPSRTAMRLPLPPAG